MNFENLVGLTFVSITGATKDSDEIVFTTTCGRKIEMNHSQDCCESVYVNDVEGDINDLLNSPIVLAEESVNSDDPPAEKSWVDSFTWTFYRLATTKGFVVIRWFGESNGYYSEGVDLREVK